MRLGVTEELFRIAELPDVPSGGAKQATDSSQHSGFVIEQANVGSRVGQSVDNNSGTNARAKLDLGLISLLAVPNLDVSVPVTKRTAPTRHARSNCFVARSRLERVSQGPAPKGTA